MMCKGLLVRDILDDLGLPPSVAKAVRKELIAFRKAYVKLYDIDLASDFKEDCTLDPIKEMVRTYLEDGLPEKEILPGKAHWTANVSAAQTEHSEYPIPMHRIVELLQKLMVIQIWNFDRTPKPDSIEETSSLITSDSEQNYAVGPTRERGPCGTRSGLRSSGLDSVEGSTEYMQVAPVAKMEPNSGDLERTNHYTYDGRPDIVDLEAGKDQEAMTSEPMRDDHHVLPQATLGGVSADTENHEGSPSGLADLSPAIAERLENTIGTSHQQSPTQGDNPGFQQRTQQSNLGQTSMVGPYQRRSKVIVLKWKQHKRRATEEGLPHMGSTENSPSLATVSQNDSLDEGTKRRRLGDKDSISTLPQPVDVTDSNDSDVGYPSHISQLPAVEIHQSERFQAISKLSDGGADSLSTKERSARMGSKTPSVPNQIREQEQVDQGPGDSKIGLQLSAWLLDPRKPGGCLTGWPGNNPLSHSVHYIFEKTTELLETDSYSGIQFLFELNNHGGEVKFQVTKGASKEFQIMKDTVPRILKKAIARSKKKATAIELTLRPLGLTEVSSSDNAVVATMGDQDLYGIDALLFG